MKGDADLLILHISISGSAAEKLSFYCNEGNVAFQVKLISAKPDFLELQCKAWGGTENHRR